MQVYLVGGAIRDELLGLPIKEKDWVVVGASPEQMLKQGYRQVGKDFPVFLHPKTQEEYALARRERKVGLGYTGFDFDTSPKVTLEEDLMRRDFTINAIARTLDGKLVDPYHGKEDCQNRILRHVSPAFAEDPVRILRGARFAARFADLGFRIADETNALMQQMVRAGEVDALVPERVWKEFERALKEKSPEQFLVVLDKCGALSKLFPGITMDGKNFQSLINAKKISEDPEVRFATLLSTFSAPNIKKLCNQYRIPNNFRELALLVAEHWESYLLKDDITAADILKLFQSTDAFRREARFKKFLLACEAITNNFQSADRLSQMLEMAKNINVKELLSKTIAGKEISELIYQKRLEALEIFFK